MSPMSQQMQNAQKLYMRGIQDGQIDEVHRHYMGASYTQHSTGVPDVKVISSIGFGVNVRLRSVNS